jgi:hypothetical protein
LGTFYLAPWYIDGRPMDASILREICPLPGINLAGFLQKKLCKTTPNFNKLFKRYCDEALYIMKLPIMLDDYYNNYGTQWSNLLAARRLF